MGLIPDGTTDRVRVKICGITRPGDAVTAISLGADAIGMVFYPGSPRFVDIESAQRITQELGANTSKVGLFVNAPESNIRQVLDAVPLDIIQFHGDEPPDFCQQFSVPFIKAVRVQDNTDLIAVSGCYDKSLALLLDTYVAGIPGGTGIRFNWSKIPPNLNGHFILAGGLTAENVADAVRQVKPYAVDVSGGVESEKGIKDSKKIKAFINEVKNANN